MCKKKLFRHYATASFCNARGGKFGNPSGT